MFGEDLPKEMPKVTITTFVEEEIKDGLKLLAERERRSMSQMIAFLVEEAVETAIRDGLIPGKSKSEGTE